MRTKILSLKEPDAIELAVQYLQRNNVVALPTDTVYGLMVRAEISSAIEKLFIAKGRPSEKAIPVLLSHPEQMDTLVKGPPSPEAKKLMELFWPGPLTLVMRAQSSLPNILTAGQNTVAVRIPDHGELRQIIDLVGPVAATSANLSDHPPAVSAAEVYEQLSGRIPLILDGGTIPGGRASTVVDVTGRSGVPVHILREGAVAGQIKDNA